MCMFDSSDTIYENCRHFEPAFSGLDFINTLVARKCSRYCMHRVRSMYAVPKYPSQFFIYAPFLSLDKY